MAEQDRDKALAAALSQIEKQFGKGSVMRMGENIDLGIEAIPTGALSLDLALGIGGLPRGRIVEIFGPESSGKCLTADTYVWTDRGLETVQELFERCGEQVTCTSRVTPVADLGVRAVNERGELEKVHALTHNGRQPVLRIRLASGREVKATGNHPLRVVERGLVVWRRAGELRRGDTVVSALFGAAEAAEGDGTSEDDAVLLGRLAAGGSTGDEVVRSELSERCGLEDADAAGRSVPYCIRTGGHKIQRAFLSALFGADGWIDPQDTIGIAPASERLAREVQLLLFGLGMPCTVTPEEDDHGHLWDWTVTITSAAARRFRQEIGFGSERGTSVEVTGEVSGEDPRFTYEHVVSVEPAGTPPTFDLAMPVTHSFLANGILSHNTTLAVHVVAEAQRNGGICAYIDSEHAMDPVYARSIGVNVDDLLISQPDTGEQALEIADMLIRSSAIDVIVIDSVAALTPRAEIEGEMGDTHVGLQARLMSQALRKLAGSLSKSNTVAIFINQLREKIGVLYGSPETTPGGRALKFYASVRLDIRRAESIKDGADVIGNRTRVKIVKNKVGGRPFQQAEFDIMFGTGISREGSILDVAVDLGLVKKSGAWFTYEGEQLGQGRENVKTFLRENPQLMAEIDDRVRQQLTPKEPAEADRVKPDTEVDPDDLPITLE